MLIVATPYQLKTVSRDIKLRVRILTMAQATQAARVAIVTGGNKGIGLAIVRGMCKKFNGDVVLTARDESRGRNAVTQLQGEGLTANFHQLDIDSRDSITKVKEFLNKTYGGMNVVNISVECPSSSHSL